MPLDETEDAQLQTLVMKLQHDINCLRDPNRGVRRRACDKLQRFVQGDARAYSLAILRALCHEHMLGALLACACTDAVEKCREGALKMLLAFATQRVLEPSERVLQELVQALASRLGTLPYAEPTEEIRLQWLELLLAVLKQLAEAPATCQTMRPVMSDLANVLGKTAVDPFPDVKKCTADICVVLAAGWRRDVALQVGTIVKPMVANLKHQHSRVRLSALQALEAVVPCGNEALPELMREILLPAVSKTVFDHTASVRARLAAVIAAWLRDIEYAQHYEAQLFPIMLAGAVDESVDVRNVFQQNLAVLAEKWEKDAESNATDEEGDQDMSSIQPPLFFSDRPPRGARLLAQRILRDVLPQLLEKTADWTLQVRERYTRVLSVYLILLEQAINPHLERVFGALAKICRDDEDSMVECVRECCGVIGYYATPTIILASLLPMVAGRRAGEDTIQHRLQGLVLLGMSITGMTAETMDVHLETIMEALCDRGVREAEAPEFQEALAAVVKSIIESAKPLLPSREASCFQIFWVLSHLLAGADEDTVASETTTQAFNSLASALRVNQEGLYDRFLDQLLQRMELPTAPADCWIKGHPSRLLFDSLCRRAGAACGKSMDTLVPVCILHLQTAQPADVRLAFLALLETMLGTTSMCKAFQPHATRLLLEAIVPNIVWQGGRVAATIRKVAMACAYTLLRQGLADQPCLFQCAPQMLPVLKSCMDDGDAKTRQLVCLTLQYLFVALPECLGEEPVHQLYAEILKRLDDSNDTVRKAACQTFKTFLGAAPKSHFQGTIIDYTLDCLFVHLDDAEPEIQAAVFDVIQAAVAVDPALVIKKAQENRSRHQSPKYCDLVLEYAHQASST